MMCHETLRQLHILMPNPCFCLVRVARRDSSVRHPPMQALLGEDVNEVLVVQTWAAH